MTPQGPFSILVIFCKRTKNESTHGLSRGLGPKENFPSATKSLLNSQRFRKNLDLSRNRPGSDVAPCRSPGETQGRTDAFRRPPRGDTELVMQGLKRIQRQAIISHMSEFKDSPKIALSGSVYLCRSHSNHWLFPASSLVSSRVAQFLSRALPFLLSGAMMRELGHGSPPSVRSSLPIYFSTHLMAPPCSCSPPAFPTSSYSSLAKPL